MNAVPREIPSDDHQANGTIEVEVREAKKHVRTGKVALESKLQMKLADDDVALAWLLRHQADQVNRYKVGDDGKTPEQRRTGKRRQKPALEFGERVMIREAQTSQQRQKCIRSENDLWQIHWSPWTYWSTFGTHRRWGEARSWSQATTDSRKMEQRRLG